MTQGNTSSPATGVPPHTGVDRPLRPAERALLMRLRTILEPDALRDGHLGRATYRRDASFLDADPLAIVLPRTVEQTAEVLRACRDHGIPFTPRAAGTGLAGGATPTGEDGVRPVVVSVARMDRLPDLDVVNRRAWVAGRVGRRRGHARHRHQGVPAAAPPPAGDRHHAGRLPVARRRGSHGR